MTATDDAHVSGSASFPWTVTDTVIVASPGAQASRVGTTIVPVHVPATDSSATASLTYTVTGLPSGLVIAPATGTITGSPTHSGVATVTVTATDGAGYSGSASFAWTVTGAAITAITPSTGPASGGTKVTVTGTGLAGATSVTFGGVAGTAVKAASSGLKLTVVAPPGVPGTVDIVVTTGSGPTIPVAADRFTYAPPAVTSLSVTSGPVAGGTTVKILGTGLTGATVVRFGTNVVPTFVVNAKGTVIKVKAPPGPAGTVDVTVTTPHGTTAVVAGDRYTYG